MPWWKNITALLLCLTVLPAWAAIPADLAAVRTAWAQIKYQLPKDQRGDAYQKLQNRAQRVSAAHPGQAAPLVWQAIVSASLADERGAFSGALNYAKQARDLLLQASTLPADEMRASLYSSLGTLYYQVPGWPIGFGDNDKAREYLLKALAIDPDGIDDNWFYADFLIDQGDYQGAVNALRHALQAPPRPGRPVADAGRRAEINAALSKAKAKLGNG